MGQSDISMRVEMTGKLRGIQHTRENLFWVRSSQRPAQHIVGAVPPILTCAVGEMMLAVVIDPPFLVFIQHLRPGARMGEAVVGKPSLNGDYEKAC
jgi:hypothetical protein